MVESKILLENEKVTIIERRIGLGEKLPMHTHGEYVAYVLNPAKVRITFPDGSTKEHEFEQGVASYSKGTTHELENIGSTEIVNLDIELKKVRPSRKPAPSGRARKGRSRKPSRKKRSRSTSR